MTAEGPPQRRATALLGTLVSIEVSGVATGLAHAAIDRGFAEIARVHALMSFHEPGSDVSRLNRAAAAAEVAVDPSTFAVLALARDLSGVSAGTFDVTTGGRLVDWGFLPAPAGAAAPDPLADWRDVELLEGARVRFRRPLWLDLGGIAKGWAVDAALLAMALPAHARAVVNAGGDLRTTGPGTHRVLLRVPGHPAAQVPALELAAAAVASSTGGGTRRRLGPDWVGPHVDGRTRQAAPTEAFAAVVAEDCAVADALTKVVLAAGSAAEATLRHFGATAYRYDPANGWSTLGTDA